MMALLKKTPAHYITLDGVRHPLIIKKHPRARSMVVRYDSKRKEVRLTLPRYVSLKQGVAFVESRQDWLLARKREQAEKIPFEPGTIIPLFGRDVTLLHQMGRGVAQRNEDTLIVHGDEAFFARRVTDAIKKELHKEIAILLDKHAPAEWKNRLKISLRETSSRWGSCSKSGKLSFCWRLAFAPYAVLEYVVCHEIAHLTHMNHSERYWKHLASLYHAIDEAEFWLKKNGASLWCFG